MTPELGELFSLKDPRSKGITDATNRFRVEAWLKRVPLQRPADTNTSFTKYLQEKFDVRHREAHLEYRLQFCTKEEATHVSGVGVAGVVASIEDILHEGQMVNWDEIVIQALQYEQLARIGEYLGDECYSTIPWKFTVLREALTLIPDLRDTLLALEPGSDFYVYLNGYTVRGVTPEAIHDPNKVWVEVAKRNDVPAFAKEVTP